jgi:alpha 1,2-mannosyltransferase
LFILLCILGAIIYTIGFRSTKPADAEEKQMEQKPLRDTPLPAHGKDNSESAVPEHAEEHNLEPDKPSQEKEKETLNQVEQNTLDTTEPESTKTPTSEINEKSTETPPEPSKDTTETFEQVNAAIVMLLIEPDAAEVASTLANFEDNFNKQFHYPYVFLHDKPISTAMNSTLHDIVTTGVTFGEIPANHLMVPASIRKDDVLQSISQLKEDQIPFSSLQARLRHRYMAAFLPRHPALERFDYMYRLEPKSTLLCKVEHDPLVRMQKEKKKLAFALSFREFKATVTNLLNATLAFMGSRHVNPTWFEFFTSAPSFAVSAASSRHGFCHFWSAFDISDLRFLRSAAYQDYMGFLDHRGGFFYSRWSDSVVRSLAAGMLLKKQEILYVHDVAFYSKPFTHCAQATSVQTDEDLLGQDLNVPSDVCPKCQDVGKPLNTQAQGSCTPFFLSYAPERDESTVPDFDLESSTLLS